MNKKLVLSIVSILIAFLGVCLLVVSGVGFIMGDDWRSILVFVCSALVAIIGGVVISIYTKPKKMQLTSRDGFAIVAFTWITMAIVGAIPYYFILPEFSYADAFFEMMSGITTTGASVIKDVESIPYSVSFWRCFSNWLGGMGVVLLSIAILPMLGIGGMQLYKAEVPEPTSNNRLNLRISSTAKNLWFVYLLLSVVLVFILYFLGMNVFDAFCHTMSTMSTGGFSTKNASIGYFSPTIQYVIVLFMFLSGINFVLHIRALKGNIKSYFFDEECRSYILIIFLVSLVLTLYLASSQGYDWERAFRSALFQVVSILTTTGFGNDNYAMWGGFGVGLILLLYFIGGCGGSTSGGLKITRVLHLFKNAKQQLRYALSPHYLSNIRVDGVRVKKTTIEQLSTFFFLYIILFIVVVFVLFTVEGIDIQTAFSSSIACLGNVGPGVGRINQASNYAFFPDYAKTILAIAMVVGRLEIYTIMVLFTTHFWKKN